MSWSGVGVGREGESSAAEKEVLLVCLGRLICNTRASVSPPPLKNNPSKFLHLRHHPQITLAPGF